MLSNEERNEIENDMAVYPQKRAACIEALKTVQRHRRWVSDEALNDVAEFLGMSTEELDSVATFYNAIYRRPVGRHVILVCDSVTCWLVGYEAIYKKLKEMLNIQFGQTTDDDRFTLLPIPCLGTCDRAPAMIVDEDLHRDLNPAKLDEILERYP